MGAPSGALLVSRISSASQERQNLATGTHPGTDCAFIGRTGLHVLRTERDPADLLPRIKACRRNAHGLTVLIERCGERPAWLRKHHAMPPPVEVNSDYVTVEIEIAPSEHAVHVGA